VDTLRLDSRDRPSDAASLRGTDRRYSVQWLYENDGLPHLTRLNVGVLWGYQNGQPIFAEVRDSIQFGYDAAMREDLVARFPGGVYHGTRESSTRDGLPKEIRIPTGTTVQVHPNSRSV
jgi:hypothetical protein